jgi:anti-anti-sigma factor
MPQASGVANAAVGKRRSAPATSSTLACTWKVGAYGAAWVRLAGELSLETSLQLRYTLAEAQLQASLLVLDLRELTFMDCVGMQIIIDAVADARKQGGHGVVVRGPAEVDTLFDVTGAAQDVMIIDLPPTEPSSALFERD